MGVPDVSVSRLWWGCQTSDGTLRTRAAERPCEAVKETDARTSEPAHRHAAPEGADGLGPTNTSTRGHLPLRWDTVYMEGVSPGYV